MESVTTIDRAVNSERLMDAVARLAGLRYCCFACGSQWEPGAAHTCTVTAPARGSRRRGYTPLSKIAQLESIPKPGRQFVGTLVNDTMLDVLQLSQAEIGRLLTVTENQTGVMPQI